MDEEITIAHARDHITSGEYWLRQSERAGGSTAQDHLEAAIATAHFSAAMAITNILLADPAEAPEVLER